MSFSLSIIVAMAHNSAIGKSNGLPWDVPEDLKYFRKITAGKPVIMGRKTYESIIARIGKPLPKRHNVVITRQQNYVAEQGVSVASNLPEAIEIAGKNNPTEVFIIGGEQIYKQALPLVDNLYITKIDVAINGADAHFPKVDLVRWKLVSSVFNAAQKNIPAFTFEKWKK